MGTSAAYEARVAGADIPIVTFDLSLSDTRSVLALVTLGAGVAVRAGAFVRRKNTSGDGIAAVVGARVPVAANHRRTGSATFGPADVVEGAGVAVRAGCVAGAVDAPEGRVATLEGAGVGVVAIEALCAQAEPVVAMIRFATRIGVIAGYPRQRDGLAAYLLVTHILGAGVPVVARNGDAGLARPLDTMVAQGALVPVAAIDGRVGKEAPELLVTGILGAGVTVLADHGLRQADSLSALVRKRAGISIVASQVAQGNMAASPLAGAAVFGAGVFVVAGAFIHVPVAVVIYAVT
jgi:hypothetical protein